MIKIILAEDQVMVSGALVALLKLEGDIDVLGQAKNGKEALELCKQLQPDVVVTDIEMPIMTGLELAAEIAQLKLPIKVIVLTTFARAGFLKRAMASGVRGYMLKDAPAEDLAKAIRTVQGGGKAIAPELAMESWGGPQDPLSERERQVLRLAGTGSTSSEIGKIMHLSEGTVRNYLSEAISKLNAKNRVEAFRMARDEGWL
nr:response regulator transcription factor [uncultured Undibacterium sp.]